MEVVYIVMGKRGLLIFIAVLIVLNGALFYIFTLGTERTLRVTFLKVGQGDAILIQTPTGEEILIDGGPDRSVLRELPKRMGPFDRSIDMVIATHPDKDHIAGLADVFERYRVAVFMEPRVQHDTSYAQALTHAANTEKKVEQVAARRGMRIHMGGGAYADVLFPDREVTEIESNTGSVVMRLVYGETDSCFQVMRLYPLRTGWYSLMQAAYKVMYLKRGTMARAPQQQTHGWKWLDQSMWLFQQGKITRMGIRMQK